MNMQQVFKKLTKEFPKPYYISVQSELKQYSNGDVARESHIYVSPHGQGAGVFGIEPTWEKALEKFHKNWRESDHGKEP